MSTSGESEPEHVDDEWVDLTPTAELLGSLAYPPRLVILQHLQLGEHRVVDLNEHLGLSQSTVSWHLARLKDAGLVVSRSEGRASLYSLRHGEELRELLTAAARLQQLMEEPHD
ncbi:MAG: transcriptional regulator [Leifsonia xyli]|nr:MAG: transcriptional regulator [Leifsonia xyli]